MLSTNHISPEFSDRCTVKLVQSMPQAQVFGATLSLGILVNPASASDYTQ